MKTLVFDFDGTLTLYPTPRYSIMADAGYPVDEKMIDCAEVIMKERGLNQYEALFYMMFDSLKRLGLPATDNNFCRGADVVQFRPGVPELLQELSASARICILTCGYANYIRRTVIAPYVDTVFGSSFAFQDGIALGPSDVLSDTQKSGKLDEIAGEHYQDLIYVGDGPTDLSAFAHVLIRGGQVVLVHPADDRRVVHQLQKLRLDGVKVFEADFSPGSDLTDFLRNAVKNAEEDYK